MDAFIGQRFEDFETIAGVNVIKLYGDYLLPVRMDVQLVREILVRLVALVIVQLILPAVNDGFGLPLLPCGRQRGGCAHRPHKRG